MPSFDPQPRHAPPTAVAGRPPTRNGRAPTTDEIRRETEATVAGLQRALADAELSRRDPYRFITVLHISLMRHAAMILCDLVEDTGRIAKESARAREQDRQQPATLRRRTLAALALCAALAAAGACMLAWRWDTPRVAADLSPGTLKCEGGVQSDGSYHCTMSIRILRSH